MVLNNYWKAVQLLGSLGSSGNISSGMVKTNGSGLGNVITGLNGTDGSGRYRLRTQNVSVIVGKGTGTVSASDYDLFDDCTASISNFSYANQLNATDDGLSQVFTLGGNNNTKNDITITEVGIVKRYQGGYEISGQDVSEWNDVLFVKMLLSAPVTVPAGGSFQLSVKWEEK